MKSYAIILIPDKETTNKVEKIRMQETGNELVDNLLPHVTFKRTFLLEDSCDVNKLIDMVKKFDIQKTEINFSEVEKFFDAVVLISNDKKIIDKHKKIAELLKKSMNIDSNKFEGDNFKPHMTLFRNSDSREFQLRDFNILNATICEIALFEIGENFVKEVFSKKL